MLLWNANKLKGNLASDYVKCFSFFCQDLQPKILDFKIKLSCWWQECTSSTFKACTCGCKPTCTLCNTSKRKPEHDITTVNSLHHIICIYYYVTITSDTHHHISHRQHSSGGQAFWWCHCTFLQVWHQAGELHSSLPKKWQNGLIHSGFMGVHQNTWFAQVLHTLSLAGTELTNMVSPKSAYL